MSVRCRVSMACGDRTTRLSITAAFFPTCFTACSEAAKGRTCSQNAYDSATEFESDLILLRESLMSNRGQRLAEAFVDPYCGNSAPSAFICTLSTFASMRAYTPRY